MVSAIKYPVSDPPEWFVILWDCQPTRWRITDAAAWIAEVETNYEHVDLVWFARDLVGWLTDNPDKPRRRLRQFVNGCLRKFDQPGRNRNRGPDRSTGIDDPMPADERSDEFIRRYRQLQKQRGAR